MEIKQGNIMKYLKSYLLLFAFAFMLNADAWAQSFDANRMNRDIKIMENILGEMFKSYNSSGKSSTTTLVAPGFLSDNVRGTYLPGFGVIFNVSTGSGLVVFSSSENQNQSGRSFYYSYQSSSSGNDEAPKVNEENVKERIVEFLKDYASTIGQLKPDENVMVIYGANNSSQFSRLVYRTPSGTVRRDNKDALPVISGSVSKKDLDDYRAGKINESSFKQRVNLASSKEKEYLDLKVMGNIFETALKEQGVETFRLSGNADYLMLDNFGAIFNLDVSYRTNNRFFGTARTISGIRVDGSYVTTQRSSDSNDEELEKEQQEYRQKVQAAYSSLKSNLKEYLIDYGRTVSSVKSDQYILTTVNVRGRYDDIPERIDVQVKKSVLEQLDRGSLSREQALDQVVITEY